MKKRDLRSFVMVGILFLLCAVFSISKKEFLTPTNIFNIMRQVSIMGIVAVGMTVVIVAGGLDLSVGSLIGVSGVLTSTLMVNAGIPPVVSMLLGIAAVTVLGFLTGLIINGIGLLPMIVSLGMMTSARGLSYVITGGLPVYNLPKNYTYLGQGYVGVIPVPVIIMVVIFLTGWFVLEKTRFGMYFYSIGGNAEVARLSGIPVKKYSIISYTVNGLLCGIAGIILMYRVNSGQPRAGDQMEMDVITACVLGGISLNGGEGKVWGAFVGCMIIGVLANGLLLMNIGEYYQMLLKGIILVAAVSLDKLSRKKRVKKIKIRA